ncbi:MAG: acetyl-coenzyme A synthetase N-terminal domain-containing protein, partial [Chloroflexota bacterium]
MATKSPELEFEKTSRVLSEDRIFEPSQEIVESANITAYMQEKGFDTYQELLAWSIENLEEFWTDMARDLEWFKPWEKVVDWDPEKPKVEWFIGAQTNIVYNALDRHMETNVRNRVAFYWEGEDGTTRTVSYADLYFEVNKFASVLRSLGLEKGDRVIS